MVSIMGVRQLSCNIARQCQAFSKQFSNKPFLPLLSISSSNASDQHASFHSRNMALSLLHDMLVDHRRWSPFEDLHDQHFGLGLLNDTDIFPATTILVTPLRNGYMRPWRKSDAGNSGVSSIQSDKNEFRINLDVQQFKPEELKVKLDEGFIVVEGKHEERSDEHGFVSREFTRRYKVPDDVDESTLVSSLSSDGVLQLKAAKKPLPEALTKEIPIIQTEEPAIKKKPNDSEKN